MQFNELKRFVQISDRISQIVDLNVECVFAVALNCIVLYSFWLKFFNIWLFYTNQICRNLHDFRYDNIWIFQRFIIIENHAFFMPTDMINYLLRKGIGSPLQQTSGKKSKIELVKINRRIEWAATYYSILLENFPIETKQQIEDKSIEKLRPLDAYAIQEAIRLLLERGFIARIYSSDFERNNEIEFADDVINCTLFKDNYGTEPFLLANPNVIFDVNKHIMINYTNEPKAELKKQFEERFGFNGFRIKKGISTVLYSSYWFTYTILNNLFYAEENRNLDLTLGGLRSFSDPFNVFYKDMVKSKNPPKIRALFDPHPYTNDKNYRKIFENCLDGAIEFLNSDNNHKYVEIKYTKLTHATSRRAVFDNMAIDADKKLPFSRPEPSYQGMIYQDSKSISFLRKNFEAKWDMGTDIFEYNKTKMNK